MNILTPKELRDRLEMVHCRHASSGVAQGQIEDSHRELAAQLAEANAERTRLADAYGRFSRFVADAVFCKEWSGHLDYYEITRRVEWTVAQLAAKETELAEARGEVSRLENERDARERAINRDWTGLRSENDALRAEAERLRDEVSRLNRECQLHVDGAKLAIQAERAELERLRTELQTWSKIVPDKDGYVHIFHAEIKALSAPAAAPAQEPRILAVNEVLPTTKPEVK